jgi:expansin (peptidoglycan-binding protein)
MTPDTWSKLTNGMTAGGVDGIEWDWVKCPITSPLVIHMHGGASQYWFAATVENASLRTTKMEVSSDGGKTWKGTERDTNNFFVADGVLPSATAWVRVTSESGSTVVVENVKLASGVSTTATKNYDGDAVDQS